jgi:hypothetical protein
MSDVNATMARIAELEAMAAELKALKQTVKNTVRMKVSAKGAISIYGLQRMPVTLYAGQWERIIELCDNGALSEFIGANEALLTRKGETPLAHPAVKDVPAPKASKAPKSKAKSKAKPSAPKNGPTDTDLAKIQALNERVAKMPASDLFSDD